MVRNKLVDGTGLVTDRIAKHGTHWGISSSDAPQESTRINTELETEEVFQSMRPVSVSCLRILIGHS